MTEDSANRENRAGRGWQGPGRSFSVEWEGPGPRPGLRGYWDEFVGPGAVAGETRLWFGVAIAGTLLALIYPLATDAPWRWWHYLLAALLAFDIVGGVAVNASAPAKRWYHRETQTVKGKLSFVGTHLLHVAVVALLFRDDPVAYFAVFAALLGAGAMLVVTAELYLQRPVALVACAAGLAVLAAGPGFTDRLEWFEPMLFMKLIAAYLVFEAPFRALDTDDRGRSR